MINQLLGRADLNGFQTAFMPQAKGIVNQHNESVEWQDLMQQPLFVTTGFTACNLSCPITMAFFTQLKSQLATPSNFAMLTIDPDYDTPERLKVFLDHFDSSFIGLRITDSAAMQKIIAELRLNISKAGGDIAHTDYIYLFHPDLDGAVIYTKPDAALIAQDIHTLTQSRTAK
ncbi:MAG: SCO family protein [Amphritea sp.]|nr:SCO family protein [Amphritea sp.]